MSSSSSSDDSIKDWEKNTPPQSEPSGLVSIPENEESHFSNDARSRRPRVSGSGDPVFRNFPSSSSSTSAAPNFSFAGKRMSQDPAYGTLPLHSKDARPVNEILNQIGFGKYHIIINFLIGSCYFADGCEILIITMVSQALSAQWHLNKFVGAAIVSIVFVGAICGGFFSGWLSSKFGRKMAILFGLFGVGCSTLFSAFATELYQLFVFRFFTGFGYGLGLPATAVLAAELMPTDHRHLSFAILNVMFSAGVIFAGLAFLIFDPQMIPITTDWRLLLAVGSAPAFLSFMLALFLLDESPVWLVRNHRVYEGQKILDKMAKWNEIPNVETTCCVADEQSANQDHSMWEELLVFVVSKDYMYTMFVLCFMFFAWNFTMVGIQYAFPILIASFQWGLSPAASLVIVTISGLLGGAMIAVVGSTWTRKGWMALGSGLTALFTFLFCLGRAQPNYFLYWSAMSGVAGAIVGLTSLFFQRFFGILVMGFNELYICECFPTNSRTAAVGFAHAMGRFAAIITPFVFEAFQTFDSSTVSFFFFLSGLYCLICIATLFLPFETYGMDLADVFAIDELTPVNQRNKMRPSVSLETVHRINQISGFTTAGGITPLPLGHPLKVVEEEEEENGGKMSPVSMVSDEGSRLLQDDEASIQF